MLFNFIALLWGFAEATVFFIVPDVWISIVALSSLHDGLIACLYALAGAIVGGVIMYRWGRLDIKAVNDFMVRLPAIRPRDITDVQDSLHRSGVFAVFLGPLLGIPYKIYAANSSTVISVLSLILISIPARVIRFLLIALITSKLSNGVMSHLSHVQKIEIMIAFWGVFYSIYFFVKRK
jgi:membrane protein YqaA with SNARE-associated domain